VSERFPWRGVKAEAHSRYGGLVLRVVHLESGVRRTLEARAYDDGFAFRYHVPGEGQRTIQADATAWSLPPGALVWHHDVATQYEGVHRKNPIEAIEPGTTLVMPLTMELPDGGYAAITEGALTDFSGLTLKATGSSVVRAAMDDDPDGWQANGPVVLPWRIVLTGPGLDELVNSDIVASTCPSPAPSLYPKGLHTDWIKPGRALWHWWSGSSVAFEKQKWWVDKTAEMGFEYYLVDEGWGSWRDGARDKWELMKELVDHADWVAAGFVAGTKELK